MPLQQINVSPIDKSKENELSAPEPQMYIRSSKSQDSYGRSESQSSSQTSTSVEICRICHCEGDAEGGLIAPCYCSGSLRYVHQTCLQQWIKSSNIRCCELCKFQFIMHTKTKPFLEWEPLEMTGFERRKLLCAVIFHAIALTCVVWSLYVLIHRTAEEIQQGLLEWPFWTKLIVVAIGFTGGVVFMYIQCKAYMQICQRWKAFNRVIYVQNAPEKQPLSQQPMGGGGSSETSTSGGGARTLVGGPEVPNVGPPSNNYKDETSIDLKGVRNLHIFFNEESRVCVQNEDGESEESGEGAGADTSQWRIKIGKATGEATSHLQRCSEGCGGEGTRIGDPGEKEEGGLMGEKTTASNNDPVVKLQIKKSEIVIQFGGEKSSGGGGSSTGGGMCGGGEENLTKKDDTSVNIKIDDKDRRGEPIVIDLVKKKPSTEAAAQIRFDFSKDEEGGGCPEERVWSGSHLLPAPVYSESESDPGSHSPLLAPTVSEPN